MSEANKAVVLKFIEAMSSNDPETAAECLSPDSWTTTMGRSRFAGRRPADMVLGAIESFKTLFPTGLRLRVDSVTAEGDRVVVEAKGNAMTSDDTPYANDYCFVATVNDGRIVKFNEYLCSIYAEEVLGPIVDKSEDLKITQS